MANDKVLKFYDSKKNQSIKEIFKSSNKEIMAEIDSNFILKYINESTNMLDIGSGDGLIINKIHNNPKKITCIEYFKEFSDNIIKSDKIKIINENILTLKFQEKYNLGSAFGLLNHFNIKEQKIILNNIYNALENNGILIVKNQFGQNSTVEINNYSEDLKENYYACYTGIESFIAMLKEIGFNNIEKIDIYPQEMNRWENTHFYAIVAKK